MWWPPIIFLVLISLVSLQFFWQSRRNRKQREQARTEFQQAIFKQQQEDFEQSRAQQQAIFNSMTEGVLIVDEQGRIQLVNQSLEKLFGIKSSISGLLISEVSELSRLSEFVERLPRESKIQNVEIELTNPTRSVLQINASIVEDRSGERQGSIMVFHDLTRIKELENTRKEFVANVSHELRTPLSLIKGFAETLIDGAKDNPEVASKFLHNIDKHADRLLFLIEDLLTISRLESGQISLNCQPVNLHRLVERVFDDLESRAIEKAISLKNEVPPDLIGQGDADRLQQVLLNLVENAIKYGKAGGQVQVNGKDQEGKITISVQDDGAGIPQEAQERIFERFYRLDRARSRDTGGTGLGLSIVKHIVQAHGGEAWVKSESGNGATFYFTIPR